MAPPPRWMWRRGSRNPSLISGGGLVPGPWANLTSVSAADLGNSAPPREGSARNLPHHQTVFLTLWCLTRVPCPLPATAGDVHSGVGGGPVALRDPAPHPRRHLPGAPRPLDSGRPLSGGARWQAFPDFFFEFPTIEKGPGCWGAPGMSPIFLSRTSVGRRFAKPHTRRCQIPQPVPSIPGAASLCCGRPAVSPSSPRAGNPDPPPCLKLFPPELTPILLIASPVHIRMRCIFSPPFFYPLR